MTTEADILGRPPVMKPPVEPEPEVQEDWMGERLIRCQRVKRIGNKFTVENAKRKGKKR